jgi:cell fate regulator YaaT (PSP1 superfamily)
MKMICAGLRKTGNKEDTAFARCQLKIREHGLEMKLVSVEYTFDRNKIIFILPRKKELISGNW